MAFGILSGPAMNPQDTEDNCIPSAFSFPIQWLQVPQWGLVHREEQSKFFKDTMPFPIHFQSTWSKVCILDPQSVGAVVQPLRHVQLFATPWTSAYQATLSFTISWNLLNSCPLSRWCYLTISSSAAPFSCLQSFPASGSFPMSGVFTSGDQNIGASAWASVLTMNIQSWFPFGLTGLTSLLSKGLSRVFFSTTIWNHQFGTQPSLWFSSHIHTWLLLWLHDFGQQRK